MLDRLHYPASEIAIILDVAVLAVEDLLRRRRPVRAGVTGIVQPRSHVEQARVWRNHDDDVPAHGPPPAATVEVDQVVAELPAAVEAPAARNAWDGPTHIGETQGGKPRLTDEQAADVRRERAAGASMYALARKYHVARNTIAALLQARRPKNRHDRWERGRQ